MVVRVLVVEDHEGTRVPLRKLLELWGFSVEGASNCTDAVSLTRSWRPEVILLDLALPRLEDGWTVAQQVRAEADWQPFVIALTGHGEPAVRTRAAELGCDAFLLKPCEVEELHQLVERGAAGRTGCEPVVSNETLRTRH